MMLQLMGSPAVEAANDRFSATMTNEVRWGTAAKSGLLELRSDTAIQASLHGPFLLQWQRPKDMASDVMHFVSNGPCACVQVALQVPSWFRVIPIGAIESTGCSVMQRVLDRMVPRFLKQLQADYELWAAGDESRKPIGAGEL